VQDLAGQGFREITLLGQNVNSYQDGQIGFSDLLRRIDEETDIGRVRFVTSHPKDLSEDILRAMADASSVCEHLHLPLQSGSNRVLEAMNRGYSAEQYLCLVERARQLIAGLSITTDVIAGFPGETEADFQATLDLIETVEFDDAFTYRYSPREGTSASQMPDTVAPKEKHARLCRLISTQRSISQGKNAKLVGTAQEVMVEGKARRSERQLLARTRTNKPVVIGNGAEHVRIGDMVKATIIDSTSATLIGEIQRCVLAVQDAAGTGNQGGCPNARSV
jgi:tRNA-2-methylthio-N6-dimethylallyladenosine synthase